MPKDNIHFCSKFLLFLRTLWRFLYNSLNIPVLQLAGILTAAVIFTMIHYKFDTIIQLHVCLTTAGLALLTSEAIMLMANKQFCGTLNDNQNAIIHGLLVSFGLFMTIAGNIIISSNKKSHYDTIHGITGLSSMILVIMAFILGLTSLVSKYMISMKILNVSNNIVKWFLLPHHIFGSLGYGIGMGSLCYGLDLAEFASKTSTTLRQVLVTFAIIVGTWTMLCSFIELCDILKGLVEMYEVRGIQHVDFVEPSPESSGTSGSKGFGEVHEVIRDDSSSGSTIR